MQNFLGYLGETESDSQTVWTWVCAIVLRSALPIFNSYLAVVDKILSSSYMHAVQQAPVLVVLDTYNISIFHWYAPQWQQQQHRHQQTNKAWSYKCARVRIFMLCELAPMLLSRSLVSSR